MVTLSNTAGIYETKCSNYLPALSIIPKFLTCCRKQRSLLVLKFRATIDLVRDKIQNVERFNREILHRFKWSIDGRQFSMNFAGSTSRLVAIPHKNAIRTRDLPQNEELSRFSGSFIRLITDARYYGKISSLLCLGIANSIIDDTKDFKPRYFERRFGKGVII